MKQITFEEAKEIVKRAEEHQKQKEKEFAIAELEKILSYTNNMAKNIIEQGPPDFNGFTNKDEALALYGFAYIKGTVEKRISELKGENNERI